MPSHDPAARGLWCPCCLAATWSRPQIPGIDVAPPVVVLSLSGAIVYHIVSPSEARGAGGSWQVIDASHSRRPPRYSGRSPAGGLVFWAQSGLVPDRHEAIAQTEAAV